MNIKDETTGMVRTLATLPPAEQPRFLTQTMARFQAILTDHTRGPLDDPEHPDAPVDPTVDPRNIFLTVLMLDKTTFLNNLDGKFAQFINGKWLMAMDILAQLLPLRASAAELQVAFNGVKLTQMLAGGVTVPAAYADDAQQVKRMLVEMAEDPARKQAYLAQFAQLLG